MNRKYLRFFVLLVVVLGSRETTAIEFDVRQRVASVNGAGNQPQDPLAARAEGRDTTTERHKSWTENQQMLIEGSKRAILKTGMSQPFFEKHFQIVQVIDSPSDRRVVWKFSINEYETIVVDSIGFYTEGSRRVNVHGVGNTLSSTANITRTISRARALRIMRTCLGKFANPVVEYKADRSGKAQLVLNAHTVPEPGPPNKSEPGAESDKASEKPVSEAQHDVIREGKKKPKPPIILGSVNLLTGKCIKGIGQVGSPKPYERVP